MSRRSYFVAHEKRSIESNDETKLMIQNPMVQHASSHNHKAPQALHQLPKSRIIQLMRKILNCFLAIKGIIANQKPENSNIEKPRAFSFVSITHICCLVKTSYSISKTTKLCKQAGRNEGKKNLFYFVKQV